MPLKKSKTRKMEIGQLHIRAGFLPETINEDDRTIDFVFSTGARGLRVPWFSDPYYEELEISPEAVDLSRLNNRAAFLLDHRQGTVDAVIGVIEKAWIQDGKLFGTVRFAKDETSDSYFQKVKDGILGKASLGYQVKKYQLIEQVEGDYPVYRAVNWTPFEASLVAIAFDDNAQTRSAEKNQVFECEIETRIQTQEENKMDEDEKKVTEVAKPDQVIDQKRVAQAEAEGKKAGVEAERKRILEIRSAVKKAKLKDEFAEKLIAGGQTIDECRAAIIDAWADNGSNEVIDNKTRAEVGEQDETITRRIGLEQAILYRCDSAKYQPDDRGKKYMNMSLLRMAEEIVPNSRHFSRLELAERALSTSDLANITANVINKRLAAGYNTWDRTFTPFVSFADIADFKNVDVDKFGAASDLKEIPEGGEYTEATVQDEKESYSLSKYGRLISFTEEMVINDDMRALNRLPLLAGQASARLENKLVYGQLTDNGNMADSVALFHATHKNLATGAAITQDSLSAMRKLGRNQKFGDEKLNIEFAFLVCGPNYENAALQILRQVVVPTKTSDSNIFYGTMTPIIDPNIADNSWFTIANPGIVETIEVGYLLGTNRQPVVTVKEDFKTGGLCFKVRHIVKAKAIDWRGMAKNPGAA